jgi:hypothetical protein
MIKFDKNKKFHSAKNERQHSWVLHVQKRRHETLLDHPLTTAECDYIKNYMRTHMGIQRRYSLLFTALDSVACIRRGLGRL